MRRHMLTAEKACYGSLQVLSWRMMQRLRILKFLFTKECVGEAATLLEARGIRTW